MRFIKESLIYYWFTSNSKNQSEKCAFGGNISADGKDWTLTFGGDFTTP